MTTVHEELHELVDRLPEQDASLWLSRMRLSELRQALEDAPLEDEEISVEEEAGADEARRAYARGDVQPLDEFWEELKRERRAT